MATIERVPRIETPSNRFVLHGVSWQQYEALRALDENYHVRMTYDQGALEMMSPSEGHEETTRLIGRMIESLTEVLEIPLRSRGVDDMETPRSRAGPRGGRVLLHQELPLGGRPANR